MKRWCDLMARHVWGPIIKYNDTLFNWLRPQILMVDNYTYVRLDFKGDLDLVLPEGFEWGELGKKNIFSFYNVFVNFKICGATPVSGYIPYSDMRGSSCGSRMGC
jgi:hypothetical protein